MGGLKWYKLTWSINAQTFPVKKIKHIVTSKNVQLAYAPSISGLYIRKLTLYYTNNPLTLNSLVSLRNDEKKN